MMTQANLTLTPPLLGCSLSNPLATSKTFTIIRRWQSELRWKCHQRYKYLLILLKVDNLWDIIPYERLHVVEGRIWSILILLTSHFVNSNFVNFSIWSMLTKWELTKWEVDKVTIDKVKLTKWELPMWELTKWEDTLAKEWKDVRDHCLRSVVSQTTTSKHSFMPMVSVVAGFFSMHHKDTALECHYSEDLDMHTIQESHVENVIVLDHNPG